VEYFLLGRSFPGDLLTLIVMDIQLPDVSGLQVTQGGKHLRHIPVIAKKIRQGGCESYIAKPFSIETFLGTVRNYLHESIAAQTYFRTWRFPIKGSGEIHRRSNWHRHQGRLVGFGIVQGHMAALLADDIKSNLFQRSHQFSCTRLPEVGSEGRQEWRLPLPGRGWARPRGP
jgi:FixJ family two-component response regulator